MDYMARPEGEGYPDSAWTGGCRYKPYGFFLELSDPHPSYVGQAERDSKKVSVMTLAAMAKAEPKS